MNNQWQERLAQLLEEKNTLHNTAAALREAQDEKSEKAKTLTVKTAETTNSAPEKSQNSQNTTAKTAETTNGHEDRASELGMVATWAREFGYISIHDPTTGEWYELLTKEAPGWAVGESGRRKELYKSGNRKAYRLTSREMEKVWESEHAQMWETPGVTERGIVYEDYLEDE